MEKYADEIDELIKNKGDINKTDRINRSYLHLVCIDGNIKLTKILIDQGININTTDHFGNTPLHYACQYGFFGIVQLLIAKGANPNALCNNLMSCFSCACMFNRTMLIDFLMENANIDYKSQNDIGYTCLNIACSRRHHHVVKTLIEKNKIPDIASLINKKNYKGTSCLLDACIEGNCNIIKLLLQNGANVNIVDLNGNTPLHIASIYGKIDAVKLLLEYNANINKKNRGGFRPHELAYLADIDDSEEVTECLKHEMKKRIYVLHLLLNPDVSKHFIVKRAL